MSRGASVPAAPATLRPSRVANPQRLQQSEVGVDQREKEVMGLMQSINDLMDIMHDLSVLVIDQGTMLDRIEFNVQKVAMTVSGDGLGAVGGKCAARQAALCARRRPQRLC